MSDILRLTEYLLLYHVSDLQATKSELKGKKNEKQPNSLKTSENQPFRPIGHAAFPPWKKQRKIAVSPGL